MAVDPSTGWNTSSAFQAPSYDPTALSQGLQAAANYDPTQQSTATPTSVAKFLPTALQSTSTQSSTSAVPAAGATTSPTTAADYGVTDASNNAAYASYTSNLPASSNISRITALAPSSGTAATTSGIANSSAQAAQTAQNGLTTYSGPAYVTETGPGYQIYYKWNSATGSYQCLGTSLDTKGISSYDLSQLNSNATTVAEQQRGAEGNLDASSSINGIFGSQIAAWTKANQAAAATNEAATASTASAATYQAALDSLTTTGALTAQQQALLNGSYTGANAVAVAQQAALKQAQTDYASQLAHAAALSNIAISPVDTSATDATNSAALNSVISQYASQGGGANAGLSSRLGAFAAAGQAGQNQLNHDTAAATSYNANLTNFSNALSTQYKADSQATGNQLYSDIQGVQQIAAQLEQEMGQLSQKQQQQVQAQLSSLNQLINSYQQAVSSYGQGSAQAMTAATGILSSAGTLAAAVV